MRAIKNDSEGYTYVYGDHTGDGFGGLFSDGNGWGCSDDGGNDGNGFGDGPREFKFSMSGDGDGKDDYGEAPSDR